MSAMKCFICGGLLSEDQKDLYTCISCKRIWKDAGNGKWETVSQPVSLDPSNFKDGRSYTDAVKIKSDE